MKFTRKQVVILIAGVVLVIILGVIFHYATQKPNTGPTVALTMWGVDDAVAINNVAALYSGYRPNAKITYTQVDPAEYDAKLLRALAAGTGPDIFEISNRSLPRWKTALVPLPTSTFGSVLNPVLIQQYFPAVVANDFVSGGSIYAIPLSIDTLAMFYNKDYFDAAGIALPPASWDEFDAIVPKLRHLDAQNQIIRSAVALGGTRASMPYAPDILSLLMLQNGTQMTSDDHNYAMFSNNGTTGQSAVNFYLQFSNPGSPYYTWSDTMGDALTAFATGKSAVYFGYHSDLAAIMAKAPFLKVGIAPMLQPSASAGQVTQAINYPKYFGFAAAKQGNSAYAWDFIVYSTVYAAGENQYLKDSGAPAAQRQAIKSQQAQVVDPALSVFASQALSARSWYEADDMKIDDIFDSMLHAIVSGSQNVVTALQAATDNVSTVTRGSK